MGIYLNATFVNTTKGYKVPTRTPVQEIFMNLTSTNQIMIDASRFSVDSFVYNFHDGGWLKVTLDQQKLGPVNGPLFLNTTYIETILPGISEHFGKD